ncbi:hypothetical protein ACHAXN_000701 [Cyclotella atomus]
MKRRHNEARSSSGSNQCNIASSRIQRTLSIKIIITVPLLASLLSCNAETSLLQAAISTNDAPTIIDLSQNIPRDEAAISSSPGAMAVQRVASQYPLMRAFMVIENGSIVSSYLSDDADPKEPIKLNSVTKSWMSFLFGTLVDDGLLSLDETLGDIFLDDDAWAGGVTVEELLTNTSGLLHGCAGGGDLLQGALSDPSLGVKGEWKYICMSQIMSYIIVKRTGMTPREYQTE